MKRSFIIILALAVPVLLFAQGKGPSMGRGLMGDENELLKSFGLTDAQTTQVIGIEKATRDAVKADMTHIRLVRAQIRRGATARESRPQRNQCPHRQKKSVSNRLPETAHVCAGPAHEDPGQRQLHEICPLRYGATALRLWAGTDDGAYGFRFWVHASPPGPRQ